STAIDNLRRAVQRGESVAIASESEALLDILYELEEERNTMSKKNKQAALAAKPAGGLALAAKRPGHERVLLRRWDQEATLITILVARRSPMSNKVAAGLFLVDLACLGVKSAQVKLFAGPAEYRAGLRAHALKIQPMAPAEFNLVAKIIATGLEYAA